MGILKKIAKRFSAKEAMRKQLEAHLETFFPSSANFWDYPELSYSAANNFPSQLFCLLKEQNCLKPPLLLSAIEFSGSQDFSRLTDLFNVNGSDKSMNGYANVYSKILEDLLPEKTLNLLEVGLGTNNPAAISTMGATGKPGASLRAFRDYLPKSHIYGADVDTAILFQEKNIKTAYVDQTDLFSFEKMTTDFGCDSFDFIIDDGLHSTEANLNTLIFGLRSLNSGGWVVVEDIPKRTKGVWELIASLLPTDTLKCHLIKANTAYLFAVKKIA